MRNSFIHGQPIETAHLERVDCQARDGTLAKTGYVLDLGKVLLLQPGGFHAEDAKDVKLRWVTMRVARLRATVARRRTLKLTGQVLVNWVITG